VAPVDSRGVERTGSIEDPVLGRSYRNLEELWQVYSGRLMATSKRTLTKREVQRAGLVW
jgi:hypothetical protein